MRTAVSASRPPAINRFMSCILSLCVHASHFAQELNIPIPSMEIKPPGTASATGVENVPGNHFF
jgi:hypothetical protein